MEKLLAMAGLALLMTVAPRAYAAEFDWTKVDQEIGKNGTMAPGDVHKIGLPRTDLRVTLAGVELKPTFALGSHLEFKMMGKSAMLMGDLVLTGDEVQPVMQTLTQGGVEISALHNHLIGTDPAIFYMHVGGLGDPVKLATTLHSALALTKTPLTSPSSSASQGAIDLDTSAIDAVLRTHGAVAGGIYQFSIPRGDTIHQGGMTIPPAMGTAIAINFQPTGRSRAAITGDFVLLAHEVNPVLRALREHGIAVTALHNHMLDDDPHLFYMHFWAIDDAATLARGLRAALDQVNTRRSTSALTRSDARAKPLPP